jgi:hypothetical protein
MDGPNMYAEYGIELRPIDEADGNESQFFMASVLRLQLSEPLSDTWIKQPNWVCLLEHICEVGSFDDKHPMFKPFFGESRGITRKFIATPPWKFSDATFEGTTIDERWIWTKALEKRLPGEDEDEIMTAEKAAQKAKDAKKALLAGLAAKKAGGNAKQPKRVEDEATEWVKLLRGEGYGNSGRLCGLDTDDLTAIGLPHLEAHYMIRCANKEKQRWDEARNPSPRS